MLFRSLAKEENPALGLRAVRLCLSRPQFFKTQLRALARASAFGSLSVMFPMIISAAEVRRCKELLAECCRELKAEKVPVGPIELGVMIETPAAALCADELAEEVQGVKFGKLNVDENMGLAQKFRVMSIPTLMLFRDGQAAATLVGLQSKDTVKQLLGV